MKIHRLVHTVLGAMILLLLVPVSSWATDVGAKPPVLGSVSEEEAQSVARLLLFSELSSADETELQQRAVFLGLDSGGPEQQLRERLYAYYGIEAAPPGAGPPPRLDSDEVGIDSAERIFLQGAGTNFILLEGNVSLTLVPASQEKQVLKADRVAIDLDLKLVSALGSVRYQSSPGGTVELLEGQILSVGWEDRRLVLTEGGSSFQRTNSEDQEITYYLTGSTVSISSEPRTISYTDGFITTNREQAYFSIAASSMHLVDGGDFFVTNARLSLGRVPMLWLPFLYYPGKTFVFNPAYGFDSERGWFFSSSTELYGTYPKITAGEQSSFTSLLAQDRDGVRFRDGWVYSRGSGGTKADQWAQSSGSYLAVLFDAYQNRGVFAGFDTVNNLFSKQLVVKGFGGVAFPGSDAASLSSVYEIPAMRFGFDGTTEIDVKALQFSLRMGMYSDPRFFRDYGNRLTSFSLEALGGKAEFPQTYRSDIASFDWLFNATATVPVGPLSPYVASLRVERLIGRIGWKAATMPDGPGYVMSSITLPDVIVSASGTLLKLTGSPGETEEIAATPVFIDPAIVWDEWGIRSPYAPTSNRTDLPVPIDTSSVEVSYSARQSFMENTKGLDTDSGDTSSYVRSAGTVHIKAALAPSVASFSQRFDPLYVRNTGETVETSQFSLTSASDVTVPRLGLAYGLSMRLYNESVTDQASSSPISTGGWGAWDADSVSRHQLSWQHPFTFGEASLTPSVTTTIDPIPLAITPKLEYGKQKLSASASYRLAEDDGGTLRGDDAVFKISYLDKKRLELSAGATYRGSVVRAHGGFWEPLVVATDASLYPLDGAVTLSESTTYDFETQRFDRFSIEAEIPWASVSAYGSGPLDDFALDLLETDISVDAWQKKWWKNRISFDLTMHAAYRHSFWDATASKLSFSIDCSFKIAEFLSLDVALTTVNASLYRYDSFGDLWEDFLRSFDFVGNGRNETQFTMESIEISLVHHMADWDLHCKYQGSVVLSDLEWRWEPVFTVFLQWKAIPEIKVDQRFDIGR